MIWFVSNVALTVLESPEAKCECLLSFLRRKGKNVVDHRPLIVLKDCFYTLTLLLLLLSFLDVTDVLYLLRVQVQVTRG